MGDQRKHKAFFFGHIKGLKFITTEVTTPLFPFRYPEGQGQFWTSAQSVCLFFSTPRIIIE
jgi:hypothetical protein